MGHHNGSNKRKYLEHNDQAAESSHKQKKRSGGHNSNNAKNSSGNTFSRLLIALDDTVDECRENGSSGSPLDEKSLQQCIELQQHLRKTLSTPLEANPNIPKSIPATLVTPWTVAEIPRSLPPLPPILDETLEKATFSHTNNGNGLITDLNYEHLEWVGDGYLELTATLLISQTFPALTVGRQSQLRERLVKNIQLSEYFKAYGFEKRANLGTNFAVRDREKMAKIEGDIFEAYVAAVVLSDPENGIARVVKWLRGLWGMTLKNEIAQEEMKTTKFISPMWKHVHVNSDQGTQQVVFVNPKDQLQKALGARGVTISYRDIAPQLKDRNTKLAIFTVGVFLTGWGEKDRQLGHGSDTGKKEAGFKAAEMALQNKKLMAPFLEKKRLHDAQRALEKQAMEEAQMP